MGTPRQLVVHAGAYKTGSSSLQNHLWHSREQLSATGWLYPATGVRTDEPDTGVRHSALVYRATEPAERRRLWRSLCAEIEASQTPHTLLSSEVWSRPAAAGRLGRMLDVVRTHTSVDTVQLVLFLRNRQAYARLLYREFVRRRGHLSSFADFAETNARMLDPVQVLEALTEAAGPAGSVRAWSYAAHPDTSRHLCATLGLPLPEQDVARVNASEGAVATAARRWVNRLAPERAADFPGLAALGLDLDEADYAEALPPGFTHPPADWVARLRTLTGWPEADLDSLLAPSAPGATDVDTLDALLEQRVRSWLTT